MLEEDEKHLLETTGDYDKLAKRFAEVFNPPAPDIPGLRDWKLDANQSRVTFRFLDKAYRFQLAFIKNPDSKKRSGSDYAGKVELQQIDDIETPTKCKGVGWDCYIDAKGRLTAQPPGEKNIPAEVKPLVKDALLRVVRCIGDEGE